MEQLRAMVSQNKPLSSGFMADGGSGVKNNYKRNNTQPSLNSSASTSTSTLSTSRNDLSNGGGGGGGNTIYYSNRNTTTNSSSHKHHHLFGNNSDGFADLQNRHHQSPPLGSSPIFGASDGSNSYGDHQHHHHHLAFDGDFYDSAEDGGKTAAASAAVVGDSDYVIGPDGAQYYVGDEEAEKLEPGSGSSNPGGYSAEELYAQYGADAYAVLQHEELPLMMQHGGGKQGTSSQQYMFDLKFKTNSRTIDNTIESGKNPYLRFRVDFCILILLLFSFRFCSCAAEAEPEAVHLLHGGLLRPWRLQVLPRPFLHHLQVLAGGLLHQGGRLSLPSRLPG